MQLQNSCNIPTIHWLVFAEDADTDKFRYEIGGAKNTPEQLFANSSLQLQHKHTGLTVSFNAKAALQAWVNAKLPPVKVLSAQTWMSSREKDVAAHQAVPFDYDWWASSFCPSMRMFYMAKQTDSSGCIPLQNHLARWPVR